MDRIRLIHTDTLSCEPLLRRMPNGDLLCLCQCGGNYEPSPQNRELAFHSSDNGESWSGGKSIYPEIGKAVYATELMMLDEVVTAFCQTHNGRFLNMQCVMLQSKDSGYTWTEAGAPPHISKFCFHRSMIRLKNNDILIPYHAFPVSDTENTRLVVESHNITDPQMQRGMWDITGPAVMDTGVLISRDGGKSYELRHGPQMAIKGDTGHGWIWTEPTIAELSDGRIAMLIRIDESGWLWQSNSEDGGNTWGEPFNTGIPNPSCKVKLIAVPDGRIALLHTPSHTARHPFSLWISDDDMQTWKYKRIITDFPGTFHYPDGFYEDGHLLFTVEHNRRDILFFDVKLDECC